MHSLLVHLYALLLCLLLPTGVFASELRSAWIAAEPGWTVSEVPPADDARWNTFDVRQLTVVPRSPNGAWIRIEPLQPWPQSPQVLSIESPPLGSFVLHATSGWSRSASTMELNPLRGYGPGRIAFELPVERRGHEAFLLNLVHSPSLMGGIRLRVEDRAAFVAHDARWLAFISASMAVMLAMALMALCFSSFLRDPAFLTYALYLLCYVLIQCVQTGYVAVPLGWSLIADNPRPWGLAATCFAVFFAALFASRFMGLRTHAPRLRQAVLVLVIAVIVILLAGLLLPLHLQNFSRQLLNPLLIVAGPLLLVCAVVAASRGSRYANYFLVGWTPLLVLTVMRSLQTFGLLSDWHWLNDACIVAAAFEALVLSLGLADRTLAMHRDRDRITALAEIDPLTATLNRRVWMERATQLVTAAHAADNRLCLLFLDIDDFKQINDQQGHVAGDKALIKTAKLIAGSLRPQDLLGRFGGEEFVAVLPDSSVDEARQIAERLCTRVRNAAIPGVAGSSGLTVSIGIAELADDEALTQLLSRADRAMYEAKHAGRDRIHVAGDASAATHQLQPAH